jgi:hypothetical protein
MDFRGPLAKNGPKYLCGVFIEAATDASRHSVYKDRCDRTEARLDRQRGTKVARVEVARKLAEATWNMLQTVSRFAPVKSRVPILVP